MGVFDFLFGRDRRNQQPRPATGPTTRLSDEQRWSVTAIFCALRRLTRLSSVC